MVPIRDNTATNNMTSISTSPVSSPVNNNCWGNFSGKKRRPIDPDGASSPSIQYDSELVNNQQPNAKRPRTLDDVIGSLSLRPPDPPGNFARGKRKNGVEEAEDGPSAKVARATGFSSVSSSNFDEGINNFADDNLRQQQHQLQQQQPMEPAGRKGGSSPTNVTSELYDQSSTQQQQQEHSMSDAATAMHQNPTRQDSGMSIDSDNSDDQSCGSSVSESSIRNAMYQLVFGRRNALPSLTNGNYSSGTNSNIGTGTYDVVDSKIEDLIRRSRLEATIKSQQKKEEEERSMNNEGKNEELDDMEMDDDIGEGKNAKDEEDWNPGHG